MEIDKRQGESERREKLDRPFVLLQYQQPFGTSQWTLGPANLGPKISNIQGR